MKRTIALSFIFSLVSALAIAQEYRVNRSYENKKVKLKSAGLGKNIIAFSPMRLAVSNVMGDGNAYAAVGFSYERIFNNEYIGVKLPVNFTIAQPGILLMPTIKLYPKKQGIVKYAVGPQFIISVIDDYYYNYYSSSSYYTAGVRKQFGFAINNSVNFTISKHFFLELDASLGILYYDSYNKINSGYNNDSPINLNQTFNLGFCMGYRF